MEAFKRHPENMKFFKVLNLVKQCAELKSTMDEFW